MAGRRLSDGRYELDSPLARGGMGEVWIGRDIKLDREIAVKFIRVPDGVPENEHIRRFVRESRITARLEHPGIPAVYDVGTDEKSRPFLVMQRVHGITVADLIAEHGKLPIGWAAAIAAQVCAVLAVAHAASLVHRDLKPSNLMLERDGCVKVLDFGLAAAPTLADFSRITMTKAPIGTPAYMAPEQVEANLSEPATDLYALGCTLHEMLTGRHVFTGNLYTLMSRQVTEPPPALRSLRPEVPPALEKLVLDLLEKRPKDRPISAEAVYQRLLPFAVDLGMLTGALDPPAETSPARMYAGVLIRVFAKSTATANPIPTVSVAKVAAESSQPTCTRTEIAKARDEAVRLVRQSRFSQAASLLQSFEQAARRTFGSTDADVIQLRYELADALFENGSYRQAAPVYHALIADLDAGVEAAPELLFDCRLKAAICHASTGRTAQALRQLDHLLEVQRATGGADDPRTLQLRQQIGLLRLGSGEREAAKRALSSLLEDLRRLPHGENQPDPDEVASVLTSIHLDDEAAAGERDWRDVLRHATLDEPEMEYLLHDLAGRGLPAPIVGYELGDEAWPAELAWPDLKIAVVRSGSSDDPEIADRDKAYRTACWDARTPANWTADELAARIMAVG